jgi:poly-gamma-glutamate synthesis protein (capsule biosynthesis protein)
MRALLAAMLAGTLFGGEPAPPNEVVVAAVGDVRVGGPIGRLAKRFGVGDPVSKIRPWLEADFLLGNLECAVTERGTAEDKTWTFRAPAKELEILEDAGFDWIGLANNHVMDYGVQGLEDTIAALEKRGFAHTGAGMSAEEARRPLFFEKNGLRIGLLAFTTTLPDSMWAEKDRPGVSYADFKRVPRWVAEAKKRCDVLLVFFHGGTELSTEPNQVQRDFARLAADAGADAVIGHHPHVVQPVEIRGDSVILYSIANFLFVSPTPGTERSVIARLRLSKSGVRVELAPIDINWGRLQPARPEDREKIREVLDAEGALTRHPDRVTLLEGKPR